jgi:hypothetical protein
MVAGWVGLGLSRLLLHTGCTSRGALAGGGNLCARRHGTVRQSARLHHRHLSVLQLWLDESLFWEGEGKVVLVLCFHHV